jgi:hypothetical protein
VGDTKSYETSFPIPLVGPDPTYNGGTFDVFVAKVTAAGSALAYAGYIGGSDYDRSWDLAVDGSGRAYVTGYTASDQEEGFPIITGPDLTFNDGADDAFIVRVNAAGTALEYAGYIGGAGGDYGYGVAVDGAGYATIVGTTESDQLAFPAFPVEGGPDLTFNGGTDDAFVARVDAAGTGLVYAGYIGGSGSDRAYGIALDGAGHAIIAGETDSAAPTFPVTGGPDLTYNGGDYDAFVAKVVKMAYGVYLPLTLLGS